MLYMRKGLAVLIYISSPALILPKRESGYAEGISFFNYVVTLFFFELMRGETHVLKVYPFSITSRVLNQQLLTYKRVALTIDL